MLNVDVLKTVSRKTFLDLIRRNGVPSDLHMFGPIFSCTVQCYMHSACAVTLDMGFQKKKVILLGRSS